MMMAVSDNAVSAIRRVIDTAEEPATGLRIMVNVAGCSGLEYLLGLESEEMEGDQICDCGSETCGRVRIFIDSESWPMLAGTRIDFVDGPESKGFVFDNPNARSLCACGKTVCL